MIKCDQNQVEISGNMPELFTEATIILKQLCNMYSREMVMSSLMSAVYTIPEKPNEKIDIKKGLENFKNDTRLALERIEGIDKAEGKTLEEKNIFMRKDLKKKEKEVKDKLHELLQEFAASIGAELNDDILIDDDEEDDDE